MEYIDDDGRWKGVPCETKPSTKRRTTHPRPFVLFGGAFSSERFRKKNGASHFFRKYKKETARLAFLPDPILFRWKFKIDTDATPILDGFHFYPNRASETCCNGTIERQRPLEKRPLQCSGAKTMRKEAS
jgi:hypothetical protein